MQCRVKYGDVHYQIFGEGKPLVILHSMGTDHRAMAAWLEPLFTAEMNWKRIYVDLPAHGHSNITNQFKGTEHSVEIIIEFINKTIGAENFSLIGMSYGAYVAQGVMDSLMDRVEGICFIVPAVHNRTRKLPEKLVLEIEEDLMNTVEKDIKTAFETLMVVQNKKMLDRFISEIQPGRELANREFLTSDWRENNYFLKKEPFAEYEVITKPTMFLLGKQDSITGYEDQFELFQKFTRATYTVLDGAGHMLTLEKREAAGGLVKEWLSVLEQEKQIARDAKWGS